MARSISINIVGNDMLSQAMEAAAESTRELQRTMDRLNRRVQVQVEADAQRAQRDLERTQDQAQRLDGKNVKIDIKADASAATAAIAGVGMHMLALAAIPVGATLGVGLLALGGAAAAAGAGVGALAAVAVPAFAEIKKALDAQTQAQQQSGAAASSAQARQLALAGAQQQVASAVRQAAVAHEQALAQVGAAERQLEASQRSAVQAQRDLTAARQDARRSLEDMANNAADARLSERQAVLDAADAQANYNRVLADPKASDSDRARAKLQLDQARQAVKERHEAVLRAVADEKAARKAGVEGSDQVRSARDRLAEANRRIAESERALAAARANVARVDQQSADAVASARRSLAAASLQGAAGNSALATSMAALSPSQRTLMRQMVGLREAFTTWRKSMEPTVLPLFGRAIGILKGQIPSLTPVVKGAAGAFDGLLDRVAAGAKSPEFSKFRAQFTALVGPSISALGNASISVAAGFGRIFQAFLPYAPVALRLVEQLTARFAQWAKTSFSGGGGGGFRAFIAYATTAGPQVAQTFRQVAAAVSHVVTSLAPLGGSLGLGVLGTVGLIAKATASLSPDTIRNVAIAYLAVRSALYAVKIAQLAVAVSTKAWSAAQWLLNAAMTANPIGLVIAAVVAVVAAVVIAYKRFSWFRAGVQATWKGIQAAASFAWNNVLKPVFSAIGNFVTSRLVPTFRRWMETNRMIWSAVRTVISAVWSGGIRPVFDRIREGVGRIRQAFSTAVDGIKVIWNRLQGIAKVPANFVISIYNRGIRPLVNGLAHLVGIKGDPLGKIPTFARGGIMPGYAPGRDSLVAAVSPGEAIMRPEFTRAVGAGFVARANSLAATGGPQAVRRWLSGPAALGGEGLAFARGGIAPRFAGAFAGGGIVGGFLKGMKDFAFGNIGKAARGVLDRLFGGTVPGAGFFRDTIAKLPDWIKAKVLSFITGHAGEGAGGKGMRSALNWAKGQAGKPYIWGGVGPAGYDCSGWISAILNVIQGRSPYARRFTTFSFDAAGGPGGFVRNLRSGFQVGVTNAGVGHMAGTLLGTNVESSGSAGVRVGGGARGANDPLFGFRYGLKADTGALTLKPGLNPPVYNGLGRMEYLETPRRGSDRPLEVVLQLDGRVIARQIVEPLRQDIGRSGGNVQNYLGKRS